MIRTIRDVFDLPSPEDITAQEFVVRLHAAEDEHRDRKLVRDYVFTPTVEKELPAIVDAMRHVYERGEEMGRFIHGSFGSGKSHFMALLGMLLRDRELAWSKDAEAVRAIKHHRAWVGKARLLVVRLHMLTADEGHFDRMVYRAVNEALEADGKPPFEYIHVQGVIDEMRREAEQYGDAFWEQLRKAGVLGSPAAFERLANGEPEDREELARQYLQFKGRDVESAGIDPNWAKGLQKLSSHVKQQGYGGLVFLIDELLLWLSEKTKPEFTKAINQLNTMVDHSDGRRGVPMFVFVARQRRLSEFFPDMTSDEPLEEHLDHHVERFEQTTLQDVELRHICRQRVLQRKDPEAVDETVRGLAEAHRKVLPALLQNADVDYLQDVYPFHPALIETLIDISSLMQRERTALRLLYELLVIHYPDLPLGEFLPVGSAFEAIFPEKETPQGRKKLDDLQSIHKLYYERFRPAMDEMASQARDGDGIDFDERQHRVVDQLVKTALLAEVSPRLKGTGGLTIKKLVQLNDVDVVGHSERGRLTKARQALVELSRKVPSLQVSGEGSEAVVSVVLHGANLEEFMDRARAKVAPHHVRLRVFSQILREELGLTGPKWEGQLEGPLACTWRGTTRKGSVVIKNVRELSNAQFRPEEGELFRVLIDYPWDEPGYGVEADRQRAQDVRRREGRIPTVCWLPRHMTAHEIEDLTEYAAADHLCSDAGAELLRRLAAHDRRHVVQQAENRKGMMRRRIVESLVKIYREHGIVEDLFGDLPERVPGPSLADVPNTLAQALLDQRYPHHPNFDERTPPKLSNLRIVCEWLLEAADTPEQRLAFTEEQARPLKHIAAELELVDVGQTNARLRQDTRYLKAVLDKASGERVSWDPIDEMLHRDYGFEPAIRNLFLLYVARLHSFRILGSDETPLDLQLDGKIRIGLTLERAQLLSVAQWTRARDLGPALFPGVEPPSTHRTVSEQDRYAEALRQHGTACRQHLQAAHKEIAQLMGEDDAAGSSRLEILREASSRLAPLARTFDSYTTLRELLECWPDDASDDHRIVVRDAGSLHDAVASIDRGQLNALRRVPSHHAHAVEVHEVLGRLTALLRDDGEPLTESRVRQWNADATQLIQKVIADSPTPPDPPEPAAPPRPEPPAPPPPEPSEVVLVQSLDLDDSGALSDFWEEARVKLRGRGLGVVQVEVRVKKEK